jgi:hypothetical protein
LLTARFTVLEAACEYRRAMALLLSKPCDASARVAPDPGWGPALAF